MLKDSAPEKWKYQEHTRVKHILLEKYLAAWIPILASRNPNICYFDGFAGRGEYDDGTPGSPIIALKTADGLAQHYDKMSCFFIERDSDNFSNLQRVLDREKPNVRNWGEKIEVFKENKEFANVIDEIFRFLKGRNSILVPSFFFVDPFGFSGIPFEIIKKILSNPRTEVFFTFMVREITRFIENHELKNTLTTLFDTAEWKEIIDSPNREQALIELYRKQLHEIARAKYSWSFRVSESERFKTLYYLVHVTNNFKGHDIMKTIMFNQGAHGLFAYLGPKDISERFQMRLFNVHDIGELKKYLLERFRGRTLPYESIQEEVCHPWHSEPPYINKHYNQALKELEGKEVGIERITSKTKRGLSGKDQISFTGAHNA